MSRRAPSAATRAPAPVIRLKLSRIVFLARGTRTPKRAGASTCQMQDQNAFVRQVIVCAADMVRVTANMIKVAFLFLNIPCASSFRSFYSRDVRAPLETVHAPSRIQVLRPSITNAGHPNEAGLQRITKRMTVPFRWHRRHGRRHGRAVSASSLAKITCKGTAVFGALHACDSCSDNGRS